MRKLIRITLVYTVFGLSLFVPRPSLAQERNTCHAHPCAGVRYELIYDTKTGEIVAAQGYDPGVTPEGGFASTRTQARQAMSGRARLEISAISAATIKEIMSTHMNDYYVDLTTQEVRKKSASTGSSGATSESGGGPLGSIFIAAATALALVVTLASRWNWLRRPVETKVLGIRR